MPIPPKANTKAVRSQLLGGPLDGTFVDIHRGFAGFLKCFLAIEQTILPWDHNLYTYTLADTNGSHAGTCPRVAIYRPVRPGNYQFVRMDAA